MALVVFGQAVLAASLLASARLADPFRDRLVRALAAVGAGSGAALLLVRDGLSPWRGLVLGPDEAAILGVAIACSWGLVISLDLGADRWWTGALCGLAATGVGAFASARWSVPALLFLVCGTAALSVAAARATPLGWLGLAVADAALVAVLVADVVGRDEWSAPSAISSALLVPLLCSSALRVGLVARVGVLGTLGTPAAAMAPLHAAVGLTVLSRWVKGPLPLVAVAVLVMGLGIVGWSILRRRLDPALIGVWPAALGGSLLLTSPRATVPASIAIVLGVTAICLWPHALERGRLSRGVVLSGMAPTITFAATAFAARESFVRATGTEGSSGLEVAAWIAVSAALPVAFATGVALGVYVARTEPRGGYHPEAVFMTWLLAAGAAVIGFVLGPAEVFGALGGSSAAGVFALAATFGAFAAVRVQVDQPVLKASADVVVGRQPEIGRWGLVTAAVTHVLVAAAIGWVTISGLRAGFL